MSTVAYTVQLTNDQYQRMHAVDKEWVGSEHYMGLCYFWAYEYRHPMREVTIKERVRIHRAFLDAGLDVEGVSDQHAEIIDRIADKRRLERIYA